MKTNEKISETGHCDFYCGHDCSMVTGICDVGDLE